MDMSKMRYEDTQINYNDCRDGWIVPPSTPFSWVKRDIDPRWRFRNRYTGEQISHDDFKTICRRECIILATVVPDHAEGTGDTALEEHPTGALRESKEGKGRPDLFLAGFPRAIMAVCKHMDCELGRQRNWEKGLPESSLISSQFRHLLGYASGVSEDTPAYNLTANVWNALVLLEEYLRVQDGAMDEAVLDVEKPCLVKC